MAFLSRSELGRVFCFQRFRRFSNNSVSRLEFLIRSSGAWMLRRLDFVEEQIGLRK